MVTGRLLIVDDEQVMRKVLRRLFEAEGFEVTTADSAETAIEIFRSSSFDAAISDIKMAGASGIDLLGRLKTLDPTLAVIILTAYSSVDTAVAALRYDAFDYITKPFSNEELVRTVKRSIRHRQLSLENIALRKELDRQFQHREIIGESEPMRSVFEKVRKVSDSDANVLLTGESGTGKELIARAIHFNSSRAAEPFLAVNCGALPDSLLESELFGHLRGAFTDAIEDRVGFFRSAGKGTVLLDEIGETSTSVQVKLLRAIQEREVVPLGSNLPLPFDARIIAATNKDLQIEVAEQRFRQDLYFRLNVVEIRIPALRERPSDIRPLAEYFAEKTARNHDRPWKRIDDEVFPILSAYSWPGNIRELENCIERAFILADKNISINDLPSAVTGIDVQGADSSLSAESSSTLETVERNYILSTLENLGHDKVKASKVLGIDLSTLYRKLKKFDSEDGSRVK